MVPRLLPALLAVCAASALANPATPATPPQAASGPNASVTNKVGTAPNAGGNGGGLSSNGGNTAGQVTPKKPKCPDPANTACPAVKAPVKTGS